MSKFKKRKAINTFYIKGFIKYYLNLLFPNLSRPSKEYFEWLSFIEVSEYWSEAEITKYQFEKLKILIAHCYTNVPYYRNLFYSLNITPNDIRTSNDYFKIPFTTKEIVRSNSQLFISDQVGNDKILEHTTSGSTGEPLRIFKTRSLYTIEKAFMHNQWSRVGYKMKDLTVRIRGEELQDSKLWRYESTSNTYVFSSYEMTNENIKYYASKLNRINPKYLHVYPSSLWILVSLLEHHNIKLTISLKAIFCGSEKLFDHQRKKFEEFFDCRVFSWLGMGEQSILAGECEVSERYHVFPQYSFVELVDKNGHAIDGPGFAGEIVGTNLFNLSMPLLRYKTGDIGTWSTTGCDCSRNWKILDNIEGRTQEFIVTRSGIKFPIGPALFGIHDKVLKHIRRFQFSQKEVGLLELKVQLIDSSSSNPEIKNQLIEIFTARFKDKFMLSITITDDFEITKSGKHKFLIQKLNLSNYDLEAGA